MARSRGWILAVLVMAMMLPMALGACGNLVPSPASSAARGVAEKFVETFNKGDVPALMEMFTENATWQIISGTQRTGADIRETFREDANLLIQIKVEKMQVEGEQVTADVVVRSAAKPDLLPPTPMRMFWNVQDGKIESAGFFPPGQ
jgi:ketosteroid isomerase-like protein